jgi:late competence protein required for DNA uptake (superfamily II DNA/RNA helicase)
MSRSFPSSRGSSTCSQCTVGGNVTDKNLEQQIYIKFCMKIGKSASEIALLTLAYGEYALQKLSVFEWHGRFKEGQEDIQDYPRSGQPNSQRTDADALFTGFRNEKHFC